MFLFLLGGEAHGDIQSGISNENREWGFVLILRSVHSPPNVTYKICSIYDRHAGLKQLSYSN